MKNTVILVTNIGVGKANEELQQFLFGKYVDLLLENQNMPAALSFYTEGVKLVCEGSPVFAGLRNLECNGSD
jgi:hypothetical protein